jgi:hypothetical protein
MKNFTQIIYIILFVFGNVSAQQEKGIIGSTNWLNNWTEFRPNQVDHGEPNQILTGSINKDTKLYKKNVYLLLGSVFVINNATITIEPGTLVIGDYKTNGSLTISKGSKIIADGLATDPIVFTSSRIVKKAGDWGGIIILGNAPTNKFGNGSTASYHSNLNPEAYTYTNYGGEDLSSDSGVLRFVRIEYAGKRMRNAGNFNGLLLAGIGKGTLLENIMVSYCAGNAISILGGDINLERIVSYKSNGNDYDFNFGAQCNIFNSLAIRSSYVSNSNGSRCMHISSYNKKEEVDFTKNKTSVIAKNLTLVNSSDNLKSEIERGLVHEALYIAENTSLAMDRSVISGFNPAVLLDEKINIDYENLEKIGLTSMYFNNCSGNIFTEYHTTNEDLENWYGNSSFFNVYSKSNDAETFIDFSNERTPDFRLRINKIIASNYVDPDLREN